MVIVLLEYFNIFVDLLKVVKMFFIYDIVEIDVGDMFIYDIQKNYLNMDEE